MKRLSDAGKGSRRDDGTFSKTSDDTNINTIQGRTHAAVASDLREHVGGVEGASRGLPQAI